MRNTPVKGKDYFLGRNVPVYKTDNYDLFILDGKYNRQVKEDAKFNQIKADLATNGQDMPIMVVLVERNGQSYFLIVSGQHRYVALKQLNKSIDFIIEDSNISISRLVSLTAIFQKSVNIEDFVDIGMKRGYKIFEIINRLREQHGHKFISTSVALETVFTLLVKKTNIFTNSTFTAKCKQDFDVELDKYNNNSYPILPVDENAVFAFTSLVRDIAVVLGEKSIRVNFNREFLNLYLNNNDIYLSLEEVLFFLKSNPKSRLFEKMQAASSGTKLREVLKSIEDEMIGAVEKNKRRTNRINAEINKYTAASIRPFTGKTNTNKNGL